MKQIFEAIANLPEELVTPEIAAAGIEEGDIRLLNHLPEKYLTSEIVVKLATDDGWGKFDLSRIPLMARSGKVCECAVSRDYENFKHVPDDKKNLKMLNKLMESAGNNFHLLSLISSSLWNTESIYNGIQSISNSSKGSSYNRSSRYYSNSHNPSQDVNKIQTLLSFVPEKIKNKEFYLGLFSLSNKLSVETITSLVPDEHKQEEYFQLLATNNFDQVPQNMYSYDIFMAALSPDAKTSKRNIIYDEDTFNIVLSVLDDKMGDIIISQFPTAFSKLPVKFQTVNRLLLTIENLSRNNSHNHILQDNDRTLMTPEVCRAFIKKDMGYPIFPESVWSDDFINYCLEYGHSFTWFEQMPQRLQTNEIIKQAVEYSSHKISYARADLIDPDTAAKVFRDSQNGSNYLKEYIPAVYFEEFTMLTGLPEEFFGGETTLLELKENKGNYTYCKLGYSYLGFYRDGKYSNSNTYLILTRRTPQSIQPEKIFERCIGTYHLTWLEKMIADYDPGYIKPPVNKNLKELQRNGYYNLELVESYKGFQIHSNILLEERVNYVTDIKGQVIFTQTKDEIIQSINNYMNL